MEFLEAIRQQLIQTVERRSEPRTFADRQVILKMLTDEYQLGSATVVDWSLHGMRVRHTLPLKPRQRVKVIAPGWALEMRVVWVAQIDGHNYAGLVLDAQVPAIQGRVVQPVLH